MPTEWTQQEDGSWLPKPDQRTPLAVMPPASNGTAATGVLPFAARADHDHDFSAAAHDHDEDYSPIGHTHAAATDVDEIPFSQKVITAETSGRYYPTRTTTLKKVVCSLGTAGSSSTVVDVKKNGSSLGTITLASSDQYESSAFNTSFTADTDYLTMTVSSVGTGAANLVATARFET